MKNLGRVFWAVTVLCALAACRSFSARVVPERNLINYQRFFVKSNLDDNHGLDEFIVKALQAHGRIAETGPLTMMPRDAQALVIFHDAWNWDFKYHLVGLTIAVSDIRAEKPIAEANYSGPVAMMTGPTEVIDRLVDQLLKARIKAPANLEDGPNNPSKNGVKDGRRAERQTSWAEH